MKIAPAVASTALIAAGLAACQATPGAAIAAPNRMLIDSGFVAKRATSPAQSALLASLPPNRMVKQTRNGTTTYYYADPACHCVHVGNQSAFASFRAMQNTVFEMNQVQVNPGIGMGAFNDLDSWQPL
jgi:hypothetical protein